MFDCGFHHSLKQTKRIDCAYVFSSSRYRCVSYGVLPTKKAEKLFKIVTERKKNQRAGGMLSSSPKKKKIKVVKEEAVDPDMQTSGADKVGSAVL